MSKIKLLPPHEAQKIAAGEVVERPANVVKELVENALDAGATQVSLHIKKAGKELIRIVDNGCGMSTEDAKLSFKLHATSKISAISDLQTINSFGFRGEALSSISSVSHVTLKTKQEQDELGTTLSYSHNEVLDEKESALPNGTDISIADLFYNIPARKKFLKRDETEWNQIQAIFHAFCLSHLDVHFKLFNNEKLVLNAPPIKTVKDRVSQIWGYNVSQNLIPLSDNQASISRHTWFSFSGIISHHNFWRYGRTHMFFFVNNRWVKNPELSKALMKGYLNVLPPQKFPAGFVFLTVDNDHIDFNVHPKKEEVRFIKPRAIQDALTFLVKDSLQQNLDRSIGAVSQQADRSYGSIHPSSPFDSAQDSSGTHHERVANNASEANLKTQTFEKTFDASKITQKQTLPRLPEFFNPKEKNIKTVHGESNSVLSRPKVVSKGRTNEKQKAVQETFQEKTVTPEPTGKIIGQLYNTYILIEQENAFVMIDQHAAHERIIYEKNLKNFEKKDGVHMLFPQIIKLSSEDELALVLKEKEFFFNQGFEIEAFGDQELAVKTSPPKIKGQDIQEIILQAIAFIQEHESLEEEMFRKKLNEHVHSHMACKSAIKAGDKLDHDAMLQLIKDLQSVENRLICVHGRPTTWSIPKVEVEKKFRRR